MWTSSPSRRRRSFMAVALSLTLVGVVSTPLAFAKIMRNTIDAVASVTDDGRHLIVTGPISCTERERVSLRVTISQRATGAVAEGHTRLTCTGEGEIQQWEVHAVTTGAATFEEGSAWAVALARTTDRLQRKPNAGDTTDAHQWLVNITLVRE